MKQNEIVYVDGDLFEIEAKVDSPHIIAHVCNNQGGWGAGFVIPLGRKYHIAKLAYQEWHKGAIINGVLYQDESFKLGEIQAVSVRSDICVVNMIAQTLSGERPLYYNHLCKCMDKVAFLAGMGIIPNSIICPQFGSGLAGGNWNIIKHLIHDCWCRIELNVTVVRYKERNS